MAKITKKQILEAAKPKTIVHEVEEWGGEVNIKLLKMSERLEIEERFLDSLPGEDGQKQIKPKDMQTLYALVTVEALVDDDGKPLFETTSELYNLAGPIQKIVADIFMIAAGSKEAKKSNTDS